MKIGTWILTISLAASAWAQSPAPKPQATTKPQATAKPQAALPQSAAKPNASSAAKTAAPAAKSAAPAVPSAKSAKAAAEKQASASSANSGAAKPGKQSGKQAPKQAKAERKESPGKTVAKAGSVYRGKRDPFVSPIREKTGAVCIGAGKRCLFIGDLSLLGIVESSNGVIAVVASGRRTYFLRENDPLADGEVERITSDAITLRQRTSDVLGRPVVREVTRRIGMPAV